MLFAGFMGRTLHRLGDDEQGHAVLGYVLVTGFFSVLVIQPELLVAVVYRISDFLSLLVSQIDVIF
jgi:Flp pilus assembly pilin Flp